MPAWMPIGRFARSVRLSVKALRRYDAEGLLSPAYVDPDTGYRYYRPEQGRHAVAIKMLRQLDVPLATIRRILTDGAGTELLDQHRARLERELALKRAALASVERLLAARDLFPHPVQVVDEPDRRVAALDVVTSPERLEADTTDAVRRLLRSLSSHGAGPFDPVGCLMHEPEDAPDLRITVVATLPADATPVGGDVRVQRLPGGRFAKTLHRGSYEALGLAHAAVFAWVRERGHTISGPARETYVDDPAEVDSASLRTEVLLPFDSS